MKIYTRTGDDGTTGLIGGERVGKDDARVQTVGAVDELNAAIGIAVVVCKDAQLQAMLGRVQNELFDLGAELATPAGDQAPSSRLTDAHIQWLEQRIDELTDALPPLTQFILPGGGETAARLHFARTICRRAERLCVALSRKTEVNPIALTYLNRLSDLLFVMARTANQIEGRDDVAWEG